MLGHLFEKCLATTFRPAAVNFAETDTDLLLNSGGRHLIANYWGSYLALIFDKASGQHLIIRDPIGHLPCYRATAEGLTYCFSHIEDYQSISTRSLEVDRSFMVRWLLYSGIRSHQTAVSGVEEVLPGRCLKLSKCGASEEVAWDAADFVRSRHLEDPHQAAEAVRTTIQGCVNAWASRFERVALKLSGGLDSSIVAGCLAHAPSKPYTIYVNFGIDAPGQMPPQLLNTDSRAAEKMRAMGGQGDETYFARLVAEHWGVPLLERRRSVEMDLLRMWQAPFSARPPLYHTSMEVDDAEVELAQLHGIQGIFSGQGGDAVLLATTQCFGAIDYAFDHGFGPRLWQHILSSSKLSRESVWAVLWKALEFGRLRRPYPMAFSVVRQNNLLTQDALQQVSDDDFVSVPEASKALAPGKLNHLSGLGGSAYHSFIFRSGEFLDHADPLNSQPVWELLLELATYVILCDGVPRGLARRAFEDLLPAEIRQRYVKGTGTSFYQRLVRRNLTLIRKTLVGGHLVREGYLDRQKVVNCLDSETPSLNVSAMQLLGYFAAEVWMDRVQQLNNAQMRTHPVAKVLNY